jgi:hypothetical protein
MYIQLIKYSTYHYDDTINIYLGPGPNDYDEL